MRGFQHLILWAVLLAVSFTVGEGPDTVIGRLWWLAGCGFFLLWQPLVSANRQLSVAQVALVVAAVAMVVFQLDWLWLTASVVLLAALVGGKVIVERELRLGGFYLCAFAYLSALLFVSISPNLYGSAVSEALPLWSFGLVVGVLVVATILMPWRRVEEKAKVFDFLVSLLILLILSSVLMAVGLFVAIARLPYLEALARSLVGLGGAVLVLSWLWNPRLGFGGFAPIASRYLLRLGFPFEDWLRRISDLFDQEENPESFLEKALESFTELPWVVGGAIVRGETRTQKNFGAPSRSRTTLVQGDLRLDLYTSYAWSASLNWQASILFKLVVDFYRARQREKLLRQLQYVQAVHETGSRVTHDVKNLLQSLEGLCFALDAESSSGGDDRWELVELMRRQLPVISRRLRSTLEKLSAPSSQDSEVNTLEKWWHDVQLRHQASSLVYVWEKSSGGDCWVPAAVFDNVVDNLIGNALQKQLQDSTLKVTVRLSVQQDEITLSVEDTGVCVSDRVIPALFNSPVSSETGFGVGLFHAAQLAGRYGYCLRLSGNQPGAVVFELRGVSKLRPSNG